MTREAEDEVKREQHKSIFEKSDVCKRASVVSVENGSAGRVARCRPWCAKGPRGGRRLDYPAQDDDSDGARVRE